jgi:hypothetical protein
MMSIVILVRNDDIALMCSYKILIIIDLILLHDIYYVHVKGIMKMEVISA